MAANQSSPRNQFLASPGTRVGGQDTYIYIYA